MALTRKVGGRFGACELEFLERRQIDIAKAREQHAAYEAQLTLSGFQVISLPHGPDCPDSVFVEDPAVVLDEIAIMTRMKSETRREEAASLADALAKFRNVRWIQGPSTLEGGDVLRIGKNMFVGLSRRTDRQGIEQFIEIAGEFGYSVTPVDVGGCLHLKTGCCSAGEDTILINRAWIDARPFAAYRILDIPETEPFGANVLASKESILVPASAPRTRDLLETRGFQTRVIDISELAKAEAGLTCMSLLFESRPSLA